MRLPFAELRTIGKRGQPLKRPLALSAITPEAAERERQNMLLDHPVCWECCGPADAGALLMVIKMWGWPTPFLVCSACGARVRRRRRGLRKVWFAPDAEIAP
ncbi:MAG: hypothetical protein M0038_04945 [Pseudomonadota bacterium]|jgi:hypothetical protein|nr:hypothetical protein [Pseudomonadota bacterium]